MKNVIDEIKNGIKIHLIETNKFKTNLLAVFLTVPMNKNNVTGNTLIPAVLRRGTKNMVTLEEISKNMENMYGASFDCGIDKIGDNQVIKFYLEVVNDEFLPQGEKILQEAINRLMEIVFNPVLENGKFKTEYVENEKENLRQRIDGKIDNKAQYAMDKCIENMYKNQPFGIYKYGYSENIDDINAENLYAQYEQMIKKCKIDIFVSGDVDESIFELIKKNEDIDKLAPRTPEYIKNNVAEDIKDVKENLVEEKMDISQGKLIIGMNILENSLDEKYVAAMYNAILGGTPTSKLFQNVREKAGLAYTASSNFIKIKNCIFIKCGIECENYEKAIEIIKKQLMDIKYGNITPEELESARTNILAMIKFIPDEQDTEITYYLGQELSDSNIGFEEYAERISKVGKEQIMELGNKIKINTIYFLKKQ